MASVARTSAGQISWRATRSPVAVRKLPQAGQAHPALAKAAATARVGLAGLNCPGCKTYRM
eukprot:11223610-Lingulodinium_polyedra.AAC.1